MLFSSQKSASMNPGEWPSSLRWCKEGGMCSFTVLKVVVEVTVSPAMKASCSSRLEEEEDADLSQEMGELSLDAAEKVSSGGSCARPRRVCKGKHIVSGVVGDCRENELPLASGTAASARVKIPAMGKNISLMQLNQVNCHPFVVLKEPLQSIAEL